MIVTFEEDSLRFCNVLFFLGACYSAFPGDFYTVANDQKSICVNAKDQIIRCSDGRPFKLGKDYYMFSEYNKIQ